LREDKRAHKKKKKEEKKKRRRREEEEKKDIHTRDTRHTTYTRRLEHIDTSKKAHKGLELGLRLAR
jgi:hypothetical protein